jgi:hypothetical protein
VGIDKPLSVAGPGGLTIATDGILGDFFFGAKGSVSFLSTANALTIDGNAYTLVDSVASLAAAIAANPSGDYALARSYDAGPDGTYSASPVPTDFLGKFDGLGNAISHLSIRHKGNDRTGLFSSLEGSIENLSLTHIDLTATGRSQWIGGLVAGIGGDATVVHDRVSGAIRSKSETAVVGGLVGFNDGFIDRSSSDARIAGSNNSRIGGLVGVNWRSIRQSFASGNITGGDFGHVGGLVGDNEFPNPGGGLENSYATGTVSGGANSQVGGLVGRWQKGENGMLATSYSIGQVAGGDSSVVGGFIGSVPNNMNVSDCYWDTTTSGTDQGTGEGNRAGITGLMDEQLKSGLPEGFDPAIWAQDPSINSGYPYLIANPPRK